MHFHLPLRAVVCGLAAALLLATRAGLAQAPAPHPPAPRPQAPAPAPAAALADEVRAAASTACEAAVVASFQRARRHANDPLSFQAAQRKTRLGAKNIVSATGAATYTKTGKPVKLTYRCTYDSKAGKVTASRWR